MLYCNLLQIIKHFKLFYQIKFDLIKKSQTNKINRILIGMENKQNKKKKKIKAKIKQTNKHQKTK